MVALSRFISRLGVRGLPFFKLLKKTRQVLVDLRGTRGLQRLEEVFDHPTYPSRPGTPRELVALHIAYE
jgi:hypothetical protein